MTAYEYKVVPAPKKGLRAKGVKGSEAKFANALMDVMNTLGAAGWEYQRTDTLPCEERQGLTRKATVFQNMLVFRRMLEAESPIAAEAASEAPAIEETTKPLKLASPVAEETKPREDFVDFRSSDENSDEPVRLVTKLQAQNREREIAAATNG